MSRTRPYCWAPGGRSTSKNSQFRIAMITWRFATLLSELPPWWTSKFMWNASARCAVFTRDVIPPLTATSPRRKSVARAMIQGANAVKPPGEYSVALRLLRIRLRRREHRRARVGGHPVPVGAEQPVDRQPRDLPRDVPERHVHRTDRAERGRAAPLPHRLVESFALERILPEHHGLQGLNQRRRVEMGTAHRRAEERVPLDGGVGLHGEQPELALPSEAPGVPPVLGRRDSAPREERECDVGDLHGAPPPRISRSCSPSRGARRRSGGRSPSNVIGRPISSRSSPGTFWIIPVAAVCGWASTSRKVWIGAHGTPASSRRSTHSPLVRVSMIVWISGMSAALCLSRSAFVPKRGSVAHSGRPRATASLAKSRSFAAAMITGPFFVSKPSNTTSRVLPVRCRTGGVPEIR